MSEEINLNDIKPQPLIRVSTGFPAMDKALGGGIVLGSTMLLGHERGVGATTLLLQIARSVAASGLFGAMAAKGFNGRSEETP